MPPSPDLESADPLRTSSAGTAKDLIRCSPDQNESSIQKAPLSEIQEASEDPGYGWRHVQLTLIFWAIFGMYVHRSCMSVAIVAMTEHIREDEEIFTWTREQQGTILSAFLWGYACTQIPSGYLTTRFGAKRLMGISLVSSSVALLLIPIVARPLGWVGVLVIRVLTGVVQGVTFPGTYTLLGQWAVPQERSRAAAIASAASPGGIFLAMSLSGFLAVSLGWQSIFYVFGCFTLVIGTLWFIFLADTPKTHPWISDKERKFILDAIGKESKTTKGPTPWKGIFTSIPLFTTIFTHVGYNWGLWLLLTALPRYMNDIFNFSIALNGVASGFPYLLTLIIGIFAGWITDKLISRKIAPVKLVRKVINSIGFWIPALLLVVVTFTPNDQKLVQVIELTVAIGVAGAVFAGFMVNYVELSPRYSGLIFALSNFVSSITSAIAPPIVGVFVNALGVTQGWAASFYVTAAIYFVANLVWILLGSVEQQPWNDVEEKSEETNSKRDDDDSAVDRQLL